MNDYATFPTQSTQTIHDPDETDTKLENTIIIDNNDNKNNDINPSINSKLQRLNINLNGLNYKSMNDINDHSMVNNNITSTNSDSYFLHKSTINKNNHQTLIEKNKNKNIVLLTLQQTLSPSTPKMKPSADANNNNDNLSSSMSISSQSSSHSQPTSLNSNNRLLAPSSAINGNKKQNKSDNDIQHTFNGSEMRFEPPSRCTNDPGAPIISLEKAKKEFKTVSQAAFRFQFVCDSYRKCKLGTVKEKDFSKLEDIVNYVHDQLLKRRQRNSQSNIGPSKSPLPPSPLPPSIDDTETKNEYPDTNIDIIKQTTKSTTQNGRTSNKRSSLERPPLNIISSPICSMCNRSFPSSDCYTTCNHPLCIKCLVQTFNNHPKNPRWYMCPKSGCRAMLPPQAHFQVLSYKPSQPKNGNNKEQNQQLYQQMMNEYLRVRNISYKNMLKVVGEYFSSKLKYYERWRKCENCDFGFLADPDVNWYQVFELKCVVCNIIQRVQLLGPNPCNQLSLKKNYYPNDNMFKTLIFIRHGEAENNIRPSDPNLRDPNLTQRGRQQCKHLMQYFGSLISIQCILSSSMNRCIQTAAIGIYKKERMKEVPFITLECLRERLSPMFNRRELISVKKEKYKLLDIDWKECLMDDDVYFDQEKKGEKYEDMNKRAWQFYKYLIKRPEQNIAIVSHEGMLQCLMNIIDSNDKSVRRSFKNAEARLVFMCHRK